MYTKRLYFRHTSGKYALAKVLGKSSSGSENKIKERLRVGAQAAEKIYYKFTLGFHSKPTAKSACLRNADFVVDLQRISTAVNFYT